MPYNCTLCPQYMPGFFVYAILVSLTQRLKSMRFDESFNEMYYLTGAVYST